MTKLKEKIYAVAPHVIQNLIITIYNFISYRERYSHNYQKFLHHYKANSNLSIEVLKNIQREKYKHFINHAVENSPFYQTEFYDVIAPDAIENIQRLPIIDKEVLRSNINNVYTLSKIEGKVSKTGGTTGKSLEVIFTHKDIEERFAILDNFRQQFGYYLGKKTAWFSGKNILSTKDISKNRFWKTDFLYKVRYYSTFHIHENYLKFYLQNLITYQPEYLVGFPSTMYEIAKYGQANDIEFPAHTIKAIFPTAETITDDIRNVLEQYFKTNLYNQYASSEGAPFILECIHKNLHLELQSGVFEVLDNKNNPSNKGRLVVTAFNTHGTPLIRYDIGDEIELSEEICSCGNQNPLVKQILGRVSDYIYSEEMGKINLGNVSNCLKGVHGIVKFQIQQHTKEKLLVLILKDSQEYTSKDESIFLQNLRDRVGLKIEITISYVLEIPVEKSGKFRLIKKTF